MAYITFDEMQKLLLDHIQRGGTPLDYHEACQKALAQGLVHEGRPPILHENLLQHLSDKDFEALLHQYPLGVMGAEPVWPHGGNLRNEVFALQHLHNPGSVEHAPNRFRIFYAFKGETEILFEKKSYHLKVGDLVIVAPRCRAIAYTAKDSIILQLSVLIPTFDALFSRATSNTNIISIFLRSVLYSGNHVNFLLFHTQNDDFLKDCFKSFFTQQMNYDPSTAQILKANLDLLLSHLLRFYSTSVSYYQSPEQRLNITSVLVYIQNNWKTLSLDTLATAFGYSSAYMSALIRKETGITYTALIKRHRMDEAARLLKNTDMKIADIAAASGFQSSEHFFRSFRDFFKKTPDEFRRNI